jgi:hypothetical protein
MPSVQRFLSGKNNLVRSAALAASSVRPSTAIERIAAQRTGGGRVRLAGAYTGHEAADVEVEIVAAGGIPRASVPQFVGVGNGKLNVLAVDGAAPLQGLTLSLVDLGIPTEHARLDARQVQIRAKEPGAAGNDLRITVEPQLTRTLTAWALLEDWSAGTAIQTGAQWDFGGLPLSAQGDVDPDTPRIQFGFDPQVYRPWRQYKDGAWQFGVSPAMERNQPKGTAVYSVTGGYKITVTDGVVTETYGDVAASKPPVVTFYDLLTALQGSALVEVAGVVAVDRAINGQASIDVPLRTSAWLMAMGGKVQLQGVAVPAAAPTQTVVVRCMAADVIGAERWSVTGDVSGALGVATTGIPYASAAVQFTVPAIDPAAIGSGEWSFKYEPVARDEGVGVPSVCVRPFRFGRNAKARTVTFRYQRRPPPDCKCSDMPMPQVPLECLGIYEEGVTMPPAVQARLIDLMSWRAVFFGSNIALAVGETPNSAQVEADHGDVLLVNNCINNVLVPALLEVHENAAALADWEAAVVQFKADWAAYAAMDGAGGNASTLADTLNQKYAALMDVCRVKAGIYPKKTDSSSGDAGGCWIDHEDPFWWADVDGYYLPAFSNQPYISARRNTETGEPYTTMEFGFGLTVACPERLKVGDTLTIRIEQVDGERPYQVGDEAVLQTIAAGPAWLAGGVDGTDVQTWQVLGSSSGPLPDYLVPTDGTAVPVYAQVGVQLQLAPGGIPFVLGDVFSLAVEAGQYRWRRDGGAWSALTDIPAGGVGALADGLTVHFDAGAAPSFAPGDAYAFAVHQPWAVSHVRDALASMWGWAGSDASMVIDLGSVQTLGAVALARYELPQGAAVAVEFSADSVAWSAPLAMDVTRAVSVQFAALQARYVRFSVTAAPGGSIGWIWAGQPFATDHHASTCQRRRRWAVGRGSGPNPASLCAGVGDGWSLAWSLGADSASVLLEDDVQQLVGLLDWAQETDEPLLFAPNYLQPRDASLVRFGADALDVSDKHEFQPNGGSQRVLSAALELEPVFA